MLVSIQELLDDRLVARPNIKKPEELKGKRIAISRFGAASHMRVLNMLPRFGLTEKDITFLQIGDTPARIIAMVGTQPTLRAFLRPIISPAVQPACELLNMAELNIFYQGTGLVATAALHRQESRHRQAHGEVLRGGNSYRAAPTRKKPSARL